MNTSNIVLPISALKSESSTVFDALAHGRTVYVSKHGDVVAAFRPFDDIPEAIAATYVMPGADTAELTARDMAQAVPSKAVADAAAGLPSLVTKSHEIYGILTEASVPAPSAVPSVDVAAARSEQVRAFLADKSDATVAEIAAYRKLLDATHVAAEATSPAEHVVGASLDADAVTDNVEWWTKRGSKVEGAINGLFDTLTEVWKKLYPPAGTQPTVVFATAVQNAFTAWQATNADLYAGTHAAASHAAGARSVTAAFREGARAADSDPVLARECYVHVLAGTPALHTGALWKLGDLAREQGQPAEAKTWYGLALHWTPEVGGLMPVLPAPRPAARYIPVPRIEISREL